MSTISLRRMPKLMPVLALLLTITIFLSLKHHYVMIHAFDLHASRLAIDFGPRLLGIARSTNHRQQQQQQLLQQQPYSSGGGGGGTLSIVPVCSLPNRRNVSSLCAHLLTMARSISATEIIVGIPLHSMPVATATTIVTNDRNTGIRKAASPSDIAQSASQIPPFLPEKVGIGDDNNTNNFNAQLILNFSSVLSALLQKELELNAQQQQHQQQRQIQPALGRISETCRVLLFDESFTTKEALLRLKYTSDSGRSTSSSSSSSRHRRSKAAAAGGGSVSIDAMAAACLLERYIEDRGQGSILAVPCTVPIPPELAVFDYNKVAEHVSSVGTSSSSSTMRKNSMMATSTVTAAGCVSTGGRRRRSSSSSSFESGGGREGIMYNNNNNNSNNSSNNNSNNNDNNGYVNGYTAEGYRPSSSGRDMNRRRSKGAAGDGGGNTNTYQLKHLRHSNQAHRYSSVMQQKQQVVDRIYSDLKTGKREISSIMTAEEYSKLFVISSHSAAADAAAASTSTTKKSNIEMKVGGLGGAASATSDIVRNVVKGVFSHINRISNTITGIKPRS